MKRIVEAWGDWHCYAEVDHIGGPSRVVTDDPAPEGWKPRPVGFAPPPIEAEPLLWDGDNA